MESINFTELLDSASAGFDPVPDGPYECELIECKADKTSKGKTMFVAKFNVVEGPHANRKIWNNFTISPENPNALGFFFKHMKALGLDRDYFASNPAPATIAQALVGRKARLQVGHREYGGVVRNDVKDVLPPSGGQVAGAAPVPGGGAVPPAPSPAPAAPAPAPTPAPAPATPPPAPAPTQAAPAPAAPPAEAPAAAADPNIPPGMDAAQYQAFLAFQAQQQQQQAQQAAPAAPPAAEAPAAPTGAPQPPF